MRADTVAFAETKVQRTERVTGREWRFVAAVTVIVLIVTSIPYLYAYWSTPADKEFMGIMLDVPDHAQYFSWMRELTYAPLAANKMTSEPNEPVFFNSLWWGLGRLGLVLGWDYGRMYQLFRIAAGALFLVVAYWMCSLFLHERLARHVAFLLVIFGAGFGWVLVVLKYTLASGELLFPLDLYVVEGNTFLTILGYPHFAAAALYMGVFGLLLVGERSRSYRYSVMAGLLALFVGTQHAYDLLTVYGVLLVHATLVLFRDRRWPTYLMVNGLVVGLISCGPAVYFTVLTTSDPLWREVLKQFANAGVYTPNLSHLPILMGTTFLLAVYRLIRVNPFRISGASNSTLLLHAWFFTSFLLIYLPVDFQIHLINGWQVPISILATEALLQDIIPSLSRIAARRRWPITANMARRAVVVAVLLVLLPTNLYLWAWRFVDLGRHDYPYYLYKDDVSAMKWLADNAKPDSVVLSSITTGQYVPAIAGTHAFLAHWAQTTDYYVKERTVSEFYAQATTDSRRHEILTKYGVNYVYSGPAEQALGGSVTDTSALWQLAFSSDRVKVYEVEDGIK